MGILHDCEPFPPILLCLRSTCLSNSSLFLNLRPQLISGHSNAVSGMSFISALISSRSPLISSSSSSLATSYTIKQRRKLTMIESSSSPSELRISSSFLSQSCCHTMSSLEPSPSYLMTKLCKALAETLDRSMSSMLASRRTSISLGIKAGCI